MKAKSKKQRPVPLHMVAREDNSAAGGSLIQLQNKLGTIASGMNWPVDAYWLLERAGFIGELRLQVPETLLVGSNGETSLLLTDSEGFLQVFKGADCISDFLSTASLKNKSLRNLNPMGVRYPKFLTFRYGAVEFALHRMAEVRQYLKEAREPYRIQRYVVPEGYAVQKTIVHWRRVKQARIYSVISRDCLSSPMPKQEMPCARLLPPLPSPNLDASQSPALFFSQSYCQSFALDLSLLISPDSFQACEVRKEKRLSDWQEEVAAALRRALQDFGIPSKDRLEEFIFHGMKSKDDIWYFLDLPCMKVVGKDEEELVLPGRLSLPLPARSLSCECSTDVSATEQKSSHHTHADLVSSHFSEPLIHYSNQSSEPTAGVSTAYISSHISEMSDRIDSLRQESRAFKEEFGTVMKVRFDNYPKALLANVIHRVYGLVLADPRLSKYYHDASRVLSKVESSVRQVFQYGSNRFIKARMKSIHSKMGISGMEFETYLRYFGTAMQMEGVSGEDIAATQAFLGDFREFVVQTDSEKQN